MSHPEAIKYEFVYISVSWKNIFISLNINRPEEGAKDSALGLNCVAKTETLRIANTLLENT